MTYTKLIFFLYTLFANICMRISSKNYMRKTSPDYLKLTTNSFYNFFMAASIFLKYMKFKYFL